MLLLLMVVVKHGRATCRCRRPVLEAGLVARPGQVEVATAKVHAGAAVVQLNSIRPEHPVVEKVGVVEAGCVRELRAQVQRRQALGLAEVRRQRGRLMHRRLPVLTAATGVRLLLGHAEVAWVALQ